MVSKRDQILSSNDSDLADLHVMEWHTDVKLRTWTLGERMDMAKKLQGMTPENAPKVYAEVVRLSVADDDGQPLFTPEDEEHLMKKNAKALDRVAAAAIRHNSVSPEAVAAEKTGSRKSPN